VRSESSMLLPSLNKKGGGYHRDKLLVLAHPQPLKHPASGLDICHDLAGCDEVTR
ncbi:hypothetical protein FRC06_009457, partial [Ceratobasidium sp. 370]